MLSPVSCPAGDNPVVEKTGQLEKLRSRINTLQQSLTHAQDKQSQAIEDVRDVERQINITLAGLKRLAQQISAQQTALEKLQADKVRQSSLVDKQRQQLTLELQSAYAMGKQQPVKLLFNQEASPQLGRMLAYYGYLSKARANSISAIKQHLVAIESTGVDISNRLEALQTLRLQELDERGQHEKQRQQRKLVVSKLSNEISAQGGQLSQLVDNEKHLSGLVKSLRQALADIPVKRQQGSFKSLQGKMSWPVRGVLKNAFGAKLPGTDLNSGGVLISAPEGEPVSSVSQGRVAFADWIRGYGLLMIIDHGEGYMSLYGYNQVLYKEVGEWVDSGEVIAALGRSGGQSVPGLYFELRYRGQPVDPASWCAGKPVVVSGK